MKNLKFIEFITKHDKFYNFLSNENQKLIFDLDFYKDELSVYSNEKNIFVYIYIGNKQDNYYLCKCKWRLNKDCLVNFNISKAKIVIKKNVKNLKLVLDNIEI